MIVQEEFQMAFVLLTSVIEGIQIEIVAGAASFGQS